MRFLHIADLHFGKTIHGVSLLENGDQPHWVDEFVKLTGDIHPDAVLIAGDIYDRSAPSGDAVQLFSKMLTALSDQEIPVLMVAGNHDSVQRISFASSLLAKERVYISKPLFKSKEIQHVTLNDEYGPVNFWLMPYVFPALVSQVLEDDSLRDYDSAVRTLLYKQKIDYSQRNVLIAHQNVVSGTAPVYGGSESMVGNVGAIDYRCFDGFDYVALGHIHAAYIVGRESVRYAGSPMCYHFNEVRQAKKGPLLVELGRKEEPVKAEICSISPLHPMREMRGTFEQLKKEETEIHRENEYLRLVLTDRRLSPRDIAVFDDMARSRGSILMDKCSEFESFADISSISSGALEEKDLRQLFCDFYCSRSGGESPCDEDIDLLSYALQLTEHADRGQKEPADEEINRMIDYLKKQEVRS